MKSNIHPIMQSLLSEMGRVGLLPEQEKEIDREMELDGVCVFPQIEAPEPHGTEK